MKLGPAPIIFRPIFNPSQEGGTKKPKKAGRDSRAFETNLEKRVPCRVKGVGDRRRSFGSRRKREMGGTGLRAVTTYPTSFRAYEVWDYNFNRICGLGHLTQGFQRPHVSDGRRR